MGYLLIWIFIIGQALFCESQYAAPSDKQHWADITSPSAQPPTLNHSTEVINENNSDVTIQELIQSTTNKELVAIDDEITTAIPFDTSTANLVIKDESLVITTLSPNVEEFSTVVTTTKGTFNIELDEAPNTNNISDDLKTSSKSLQPPSEVPPKEATSVPKKEADPSLIRPSVVPKKEADPTSLYPSVVGKKGADPSSRPSVVPKKGADPTSLYPSVVGKKGADPSSIHARKGVVYEEEDESVSLQNSTSPIDVHNKIDESNMKEENKSDVTTLQTTSVDIKTSVPMPSEGDNARDSNSSSALPSMRTHKYTPVTKLKPVPVSTDGNSIEEVEVPSTVVNIHMKPTAATDILEKNLEIEMIVKESNNNYGIISGVILLLTVVMAIIFMGYRHFKEVWMKRHYSRMDFLVDGMYDM